MNFPCFSGMLSHRCIYCFHEDMLLLKPEAKNGFTKGFSVSFSAL